MTDIVRFTEDDQLPATADDLIAGLQRVTSAMQSVAGGVPYLRLLRSGVFAYGPENVEPEPESIWAINPYSITHGFACWGDGELLGERMVPFNQTPPNRGELPDYGFEWDQQFGMQLQCVTGEDKDTVVLYRGTSTGLRNASKKLIDQIIAQAQRDPQHLVPAVRLEVDSYHHKKYGEIYFPVLDIHDWLSIETGEAAENDDPIVVEDDDPVFDADEAPAVQEQEAAQEAAQEQASPTRHRRQRRRTTLGNNTAATSRSAQRATSGTRRRRQAG